MSRRAEVSVAERPQSLDLSPLQQTALCAFLESLAHGPLEQASYVEMMRVYALSGFTYSLLSDSVMRYKLVRGTGALLDAMAADGGFDTKLESPVARIRRESSRARSPCGLSLVRLTNWVG